MSLLLIGQAAVGLVAGLLTGLSQSPVVSAVVPAILAFSSGSVLSVSVAESTGADDQDLIGEQLIILAASIFLGLILGRIIAKLGGGLPLKP
jgi:hypothetical protein